MSDAQSNTVTAMFEERDGMPIERREIPRTWYDAPKIAIKGGDVEAQLMALIKRGAGATNIELQALVEGFAMEQFFLRSSADAISNPLTFVREPRVYRVHEEADKP